MKIYFILLLILFSSPVIAQSDIYKQVDKQGNISYTNIRPENAKKVDLPEIMVMPAIDSRDIDLKIQKRMESIKNKAQYEAIESEIAEEAYLLESVRNKYNQKIPDVLDVENDNYQGYVDNNQTQILKDEITKREQNLDSLRNRLKDAEY